MFGKNDKNAIFVSVILNDIAVIKSIQSAFPCIILKVIKAVIVAETKEITPTYNQAESCLDLAPSSINTNSSLTVSANTIPMIIPSNTTFLFIIFSFQRGLLVNALNSSVRCQKKTNPL